MIDRIEIGNPPISVALRRNVRAKRLILRVASDGRGPVLTLPPGACTKKARDFLSDNEPWLRGRISSEPVHTPVDLMRTQLPKIGITPSGCISALSRATSARTGTPAKMTCLSVALPRIGLGKLTREPTVP